jgi:hypothetical protein
MDDALRVRGVEAVGNLSRDVERLAQADRAVADAILERVALDELEHEPERRSLARTGRRALGEPVTAAIAAYSVRSPAAAS